MNTSIKLDIGYILADLYPGYTISAEKIPQGAKPPFFVVKQITHSYDKLIGSVSSSTMSFDISYYPKESNQMNKEIEGVQMTLLRALSNNSRLRLCNINSQTVDDVLHITGTVKVREMISDQGVKMNKLSKDIKEV